MKIANKYIKAIETEEVINGLADLQEFMDDNYRHQLICQAIDEGLNGDDYTIEDINEMYGL